jgi:hypothetical protein
LHTFCIKKKRLTSAGFNASQQSLVPICARW